MVFSQYSNFFSLLIFFLLLLPAVILGICGKRIKWYGMLVSVPSLCLLLGLTSTQMKQFLCFIAGEMILVIGYYFLKKKIKSEWLYYSVFIISVIPIIGVKICVHSISFSYVGFLGISYISFRIWQLIIEIHDNHINKLSIPVILYFITFFPTLSSGPIDRYNRFTDDLAQNISRSSYINDYLLFAVKKIIIAIIYKFAIAAVIFTFVIEKLPEKVTLGSTLIYMYAYTLYLFFDFAGYSNFAIGTGYLLGIRVPENFNKPFLAHNMKEFWDRWHISLSKWFGDYLFSRFVLNVLRKGIIKSKKTATRLGYMITMTVMGLWHGFYIYYLVYGIYQGLMLVSTDIYLKSGTYKKFKNSKYYDLISRIVCFQVISFGMLLFSGYLLKI